MKDNMFDSFYPSSSEYLSLSSPYSSNFDFPPPFRFCWEFHFNNLIAIFQIFSHPPPSCYRKPQDTPAATRESSGDILCPVRVYQTERHSGTTTSSRVTDLSLAEV